MDAELQAIPWMDQPAITPVGSGFCDVSSKLADGNVNVSWHSSLYGRGGYQPPPPPPPPPPPDDPPDDPDDEPGATDDDEIAESKELDNALEK